MFHRLFRGMLCGFLVLFSDLCHAARSAGVSATQPPPSATSAIPPELNYYIGTLGFGGIAGWSVGFTLKKVAKIVAIILGIVIIAIQGLAFYQLIAIDWDKIQLAMPPNTFHSWWDKLWSVLSYNLPFAGAFLGGFLLGFRKG